MLEDLTPLEAARWVVKDEIRKHGFKVCCYEASEITKAAKAFLITEKEHVMNTLAIINLARRYAKNIVAKRYPDLPKAEVIRKAREIAESKQIMALARINWTKANAKAAMAKIEQAVS